MAGGGPVGRFAVLCTLDVGSPSAIAERRLDHLAHVAAHRDLIAFGGVVGDAPGPPERILYFLDVADRGGAEAFVAADPYAPLYTSVRIEPFSQRLPEPHPPEEP